MVVGLAGLSGYAYADGVAAAAASSGSGGSALAANGGAAGISAGGGASASASRWGIGRQPVAAPTSSWLPRMMASPRHQAGSTVARLASPRTDYEATGDG